VAFEDAGDPARAARALDQSADLLVSRGPRESAAGSAVSPYLVIADLDPPEGAIARLARLARERG
jgi:hypothetical protein